MSNSLNGLRRKIDGAAELHGVVRTMKALAASAIAQYEEAVRSLADYARTVELALAACFRPPNRIISGPGKIPKRTGVIVFGTDQGLVGRFNEILAEFAAARLHDEKVEIVLWCVGERMASLLSDAGLSVADQLETPGSVEAITPLIGQLLLETESRQLDHENTLYLFHNRPKSTPGTVSEPVCLRLLPLDSDWRLNYADSAWPTDKLPEIVGAYQATLGALIREYLFVSLYRACAESLAAENTSRLAAMQRAEKNIDELMAELGKTFHQLRQRSIDEELFDVISGYESLTGQR